jgi:hypothetical protein
VRQQGEAVVPDVVLTAGNAAADRPTNAAGRAMIDALPPHRAILIGIDESSLADPLTRAALPGVVIVPRPGVVTRIALPLVATGEVEGTVLGADGAGREGIDLELVDRHGAIRVRARSDFDGFFLFETVPYGQYQLRIAPEAAATLGLVQAVETLTLDRQSPRARLGERRLVATDPVSPADRIAATSNENARDGPARR